MSSQGGCNACDIIICPGVAYEITSEKYVPISDYGPMNLTRSHTLQSIKLGSVHLEINGLIIAHWLLFTGCTLGEASLVVWLHNDINWKRSPEHVIITKASFIIWCAQALAGEAVIRHGAFTSITVWSWYLCKPRKSGSLYAYRYNVPW